MINYDLTQVKALMLDVDGVLSKATVGMDAQGVPMRTVNVKDGFAIQLAVKLGLRVAIITGGRSDAIQKRYNGLGVEDVFMGCNMKIHVYESLLERYGIEDRNVAYIGDDIPDYEIMNRCGCGCCPADAAPEIKAVSRYISPFRGGEGCVRDILEQILKAKGQWTLDKRACGW